MTSTVYCVRASVLLTVTAAFRGAFRKKLVIELLLHLKDKKNSSDGRKTLLLFCLLPFVLRFSSREGRYNFHYNKYMCRSNLIKTN